jgi:hypothetical protein
MFPRCPIYYPPFGDNQCRFPFPPQYAKPGPLYLHLGFAAPIKQTAFITSLFALGHVLPNLSGGGAWQQPFPAYSEPRNIMAVLAGIQD